jgi:hypothetical protein
MPPGSLSYQFDGLGTSSSAGIIIFLDEQSPQNTEKENQ